MNNDSIYGADIECLLVLYFSLQCKAIAAAVLGDPEAVDISITTEKFTSLVAKNSDLELQLTTYTGERDVYQVCAVHCIMRVNVPQHQFLPFC